MASKYERELAALFETLGVPFLWQETDAIPPLDYSRLYGVKKTAFADFYVPAVNLFVEVKGHMTLHQVAKMRFLAAQRSYAYYVYQATEEDWNPTLRALIPVASPPPDSTRSEARVAYNRRVQQAELIRLAKHGADAAAVNDATCARLRDYANFFERHLRAATGHGL